MPFYADLHVHSRYSRATSKDCDLEHMALWARKKGLAVVATGDFTHPGWMAELREKLVPAEPGLFRLKPEIEREVEGWLPRGDGLRAGFAGGVVSAGVPALADRPDPAALPSRVPGPASSGAGPASGDAGTATRFLLSVEISTIYKKGEKTRKVHHLIYVPDFEAADRVVARLSRVGNLASDGRPILGLDSRDLLEIALDSGPASYFIPAHVWTPWFSALGSRSGFDSIAECYGDLAGEIFAVETGLSSDPPMNWRVSSLDRYRLVSNSDAHSPPKLGREACAFETDLDYYALRRALETGEGYGGTVEFFPEEGKYHLDGHRKCRVRLEPEETRRHQGRCPVCGGELTLGVQHRVEELADREEGAPPPTAGAVKSLIPLPEILAELHRQGVGTRAVEASYEGLISRLGPEIFLLEGADLEDVRRRGSEMLAEGLARLRRGEVRREAGYDGEYGVIRLFSDEELREAQGGLLFALGSTTGSKGERRSARASLDLAGKERVPGRSQPEVPETLASPAERPTSGATGADREKARGAGGSFHGAGGGTGAAGQGASADGAPRDSSPGRPLASDGPQASPFGVPAPAAGHSLSLDGLGESVPHPTGPAAADATLLAGLDSDQRAAVTAGDEPLLIVAGPGSGKTRTLTHRLAYRVGARGVAPARCLAVTFTRRAAGELRERLAALLPTAASEVAVHTFHSLALAILREHAEAAGLAHDFRIAGEAERLALVREAAGCTAREGRRLLERISLERRRGGAAADPSTGSAESGAERVAIADPGTEPVQVTEPGGVRTFPTDTADPPSRATRRPIEIRDGPGLGAVRAAYEAGLAVAGLLDLDDLVERAAALLAADDPIARALRDRWSHLFLDEYQDLDAQQYRLVKLLSPAGRRLTAIGDPDQAIYGFRGADVRIFERFVADFPGARRVRLVRNYRSTPAIVEAAGRLLPAARAEAARAPGGAGLAVTLCEAATERAEAERVVEAIEELIGGSSFYSLDTGRTAGGASAHSFGDVAVLYRTAAQAGALSEALARSGIPFQKRSHAALADLPEVDRLLARMWAGSRRGSVADRLGAAAVELLAEVDAASGSSPAGPDDGPGGSDDDAREETEGGEATREGTAAEPPRDLRQRLEEALEFLSPLARACGGDLARFHAEAMMAAQIDAWDPRVDRVSLLTLHAAKGLEFPVVFLVGCEAGLLPLKWGAGAGASDADEERRLFYVGVTRARDRLFLSRARRRFVRGEERERDPSPFLQDLEGLLERASAGARAGERRPRQRQLSLF